MSDQGKTLYKILSREDKTSGSGKKYQLVKIVDAQGSEFQTSLWEPIPKTAFVKGIMEKKDKYWNIRKAEETSEFFATVSAPSTTAGVVVAPKSDDEKLIKEYGDQIIKSGKLSEQALDEAILINEQDGVPVLAALKAIARSHGIELKAPETKEEKIDRMAKQRDELVEKQIKAMERMSIIMEQMVIRMAALETALGASKIVGGK